MPGEVIAAAERGATRIADRVVAKIASQAAREAIAPLPAGGSTPHATVSVRRGAARVRVSLELGYPSDLGGQGAAVRRQVIQRVKTLAGLEVPEVAVQVERLNRAWLPGEGRRVQ